MEIGPVEWRPSVLIPMVLRGEMLMADAPDAIRSACRLPIYHAARMIVDAPDKGTRRSMLGKIPPSVRPFVEAEVKRLWAFRA